MRRLLVAAALLVLGAPSQLLAQSESKMGVIVSLTPEWRMGGPFSDLFEGEDTKADFHGSDFSIGFVRGSENGGDWGVSYIRQAWEDGSTLDEREQVCDFAPNSGCFTVGTLSTAQNVVYNAFYIHKFASFVTIANRVQIGMNFGGGLGSFSGTFRQEEYDVNFQFVPGPGGGSQRVTQAPVVVTEAEPKDVLFTPWPIAKIQAAGAVRIVQGFKVRIAGGLDFPGVSTFGVTGLYLF